METRESRDKTRFVYGDSVGVFVRYKVYNMTDRQNTKYLDGESYTTYNTNQLWQRHQHQQPSKLYQDRMSSIFNGLPSITFTQPLSPQKQVPVRDHSRLIPPSQSKPHSLLFRPYLFVELGKAGIAPHALHDQ